MHFKSGSIVHITPEYSACNDSKNSSQTETAEEGNQPESNAGSFDPPKEITSDYSIYPNPTDEKLTVVNLKNEAIETIAIYNLAGEKQLEANPNTASTEMDLGSLKNGVFLIEIRALNNKQSLHKLIIL